ncbi:MAG: folate family ECF transporter S component [Miniphocaeibacter sp.]|uniref:folate family ECF transporter S component n=1 Tax=Miniphocaeibacter sp. TaxID=3100973 RepID=UPI001804FAC8|nr:folate family ECF transporter S component [Gallicola sp.]
MSIIKEWFNIKELKNVRNLVICAIMIALNVVLSLFEIPLFGNTIMIGFQFLALVVVGYLYGPMPAVIVGGIGDIIGAVMFPKGLFFIGFTLNAMVEGFIYGVFFHKKQISLKRIVVAFFIQLILVSFIMTPTWIYILYSKNLLLTKAIYITKIGKYPIDVLITYLFLKILNKSGVLK